MEELEMQIIELVKKKHNETGGNNGIAFWELDHILKMSTNDRNDFIQKLVAKKFIAIRQSLNQKILVLPR